MMYYYQNKHNLVDLSTVSEEAKDQILSIIEEDRRELRVNRIKSQIDTLQSQLDTLQ